MNSTAVTRRETAAGTVGVARTTVEVHGRGCGEGVPERSRKFHKKERHKTLGDGKY